MAERGERITALDLKKPCITHEKITCLQGNAASLVFENDAFDVVVCAEVLEHIPSPTLEQACNELVRVSKQWVVIGVPLHQDTRSGATRCPSCKKTNPPWAHVNSFSIEHLKTLFAGLETRKIQYVGATKDRTNFLSHALMEYAGHPFGTYGQDERCVYCDAQIDYSENRTMLQKVATRTAHVLTSLQQYCTPAQPIWVNILFEKTTKTGDGLVYLP